MTGAGELTPVSKTAVGVARIRADESARPDRLFDDPFAAAFVAAMPAAATDDADEPTDPATAARLAVHVILRTRFYDEYLLAAAASGVRQVVLLAAGLDTRAYRLDWPDDIRLFELDLPPVLTFKDEVLADATPRCARVVVPADLTADWSSALRAAGFDDHAPTAWLIEGLLIYLGGDDADRLLGEVTALSAAGTRIACERGRAMSAGATDTGVTRLWKGGLDAGVDEWLQLHGWQTDVHRLTAVATAYGRPLRAETTSAFVTATRG
jgi:methyltransferase (TIGR00027 family)